MEIVEVRGKTRRSVIRHYLWLTPTFTVAVFDTLSYVNHSCVPNSEIEWEESGNCTLRSVKEINEGEEVTFDYLGGGKDLGVAKRRQLLEEMWGEEALINYCFTTTLHNSQF